MSDHVIHSQLICADYEKKYPSLARGEGIYLFDTSGKKYIDGSGCTAAVTAIGHGVKEVADAISAQAEKLCVHPTHVFYNDELEAYLSDLCDFAPAGFNRAWTISGGTEAIENAIKLAFQYQRTKGRDTRRKVVGRWGSYHGNSLLALDVGGLRARRDYYTDLMVDHLHVEPCFPYRSNMPPDEYEDSLVDEFRDLAERHKDEIMCFVAEPVVGAALGAVGPTETYFSRMSEICRQHDILMIADEVMTGFGRTGKNFGCEHFGTHADILACAKGISGGYFPVGAILAHDRVLEPIQQSGEPFYSGQTYSCIPLAAATSHAVLRYINEHALVKNSREVGEHLKAQFKESLGDLECVGDVRGKGLFLGVEFVKDQETKAPFEPELSFGKRVEAEAFKRGLIAYAGRGTVAGTQGDHMLFAPPLTITAEQADELVALFQQAVRAAWSSVAEK